MAALELPAGIEAELHDFDEEALAEAPFINRCKPEKSVWLPQKLNQTPPLGDFNPQSAEELLHPWAGEATYMYSEMVERRAGIPVGYKALWCRRDTQDQRSAGVGSGSLRKGSAGEVLGLQGC